MSNYNNNSKLSGSYKIVDAGKAFVILIVTIFIFGISCNGIFKSSDDLLLGIAGIIVSLFVFKIFLVTAKGFKINIENDTLEYPGGGIAADSIFSYITPSYLLQHFKRYSLKISEIREVEKYSQTKTNVSDSGKITSTTTHYLDINGEFGAIQFSFMTKGKRDELYSLLVQLNDMGSPILNR